MRVGGSGMPAGQPSTVQKIVILGPMTDFRPGGEFEDLPKSRRFIQQNNRAIR